MAISVNEIRLEPQDVTFNATDLGSVKDISLNFSTETVVITADQFGNQTLGERLVAFNCSVSMTLQELSATNWEKLVGDVAGGKHTPSAGGATQVIGVGEDKLFKAIESFGSSLVLKPSNATDNLRNITLHKCYPKIGAVSYSGTEISTMEVEFVAVRATAVDSKVNIMSFGDNTQDLS